MQQEIQKEKENDNMVLDGKEYKVYEFYSKLANKKTFNGRPMIDVLEEEFRKQKVDFSRIAFKQYRDELVKSHKGYAVEAHDGMIKSDLFPGGIPDPNLVTKDALPHAQVEKHMCRQMYHIDRLGLEGYIDPKIGRIVDYEVPIKRCKEGTECGIEIGKFDLITETRKRIYLIEAKAMDSQEPLAHAIFELVTYMNMISRTNLVADFEVAKKNRFEHYHKKQDLVPTILMFEGSNQYKELQEVKENSLLYMLVIKYGINFFVLEDQEQYGVYKLVHKED